MPGPECRQETVPRIAYQGEPGSYSEQASRQYFNSTKYAEYVPCATFTDMFNAIATGAATIAAVPIENSLAGTIHENLDLLLRHPKLYIVGELDFPVRHCLLAMPGVTLADVTTVRSHPMALAQCSSYLQQHKLPCEVAYDTAGSAKIIHKQDIRNVAAIASVRAAELYGLNVIAEAIQDEIHNYTRFLILSTKSVAYQPDVPSKTSIAFSLINSPGILCRALSVFAVSNIDLSKIESRHIHTVRKALGSTTGDEINEKRWGYVFYVDILRHADEADLAAALIHLQQITTFYRLLGAYPAHVPEPPSN